MTPLIGFTPDADPTTQGIVIDCVNAIPTLKGMAGGPAQTLAVAGLAALAAECRGAAVTVSTSGVKRIFAATQTKIYELTSSTWTDVSRAGNYTGSTENRVFFAQFGNAALAVNSTELLQATTAGAFADVAGTTKARIIVSAANFVLLFNTNDATFGVQPDRWYNSAYQDHTGWTVGTNQCNTGRLIGEGGEISAACRLGEYVVAYKSNAVFLGTYVGAPVVWQWTQIPGDVGCIGPEAVTDLGGMQAFIGLDNLWLFDGTRPIPIASGTVRQFFFNDSDPTYRYRSIVKFDRQNNVVWFFYPAAGSTTGACNSALVYHLITKQWGRSNQSIEAAVNFVTPGLTINGLDAFAATIDALPNIPFDSQSWQSSGRNLAVFSTSHTLNSLTGTSTGGSMTLADVGDDAAISYASGSRLRFVTPPTSSTVSGSTKKSLDGALTVASSGTYADGKFDIRQSGRWHRLTYTMVGPFEATASDLILDEAGQR